MSSFFSRETEPQPVPAARQSVNHGGWSGKAWTRTQHDEGLLLWVGGGLVVGVAHLPDAVADVGSAGDGGEIGDAPCPAQGPEALLGLHGGLGGVGRLLADGLAQGDLVGDGARCPLGPLGDGGGPGGGVGTASSLLELREHAAGSRGPHRGSH